MNAAEFVDCIALKIRLNGRNSGTHPAVIEEIVAQTLKEALAQPIANGNSIEDWEELSRCDDCEEWFTTDQLASCDGEDGPEMCEDCRSEYQRAQTLSETDPPPRDPPVLMCMFVRGTRCAKSIDLKPCPGICGGHYCPNHLPGNVHTCDIPF